MSQKPNAPIACNCTRNWQGASSADVHTSWETMQAQPRLVVFPYLESAFPEFFGAARPHQLKLPSAQQIHQIDILWIARPVEFFHWATQDAAHTHHIPKGLPALDHIAKAMWHLVHCQKTLGRTADAFLLGWCHTGTERTPSKCRHKLTQQTTGFAPNAPHC